MIWAKNANFVRIFMSFEPISQFLALGSDFPPYIFYRARMKV